MTVHGSKGLEFPVVFLCGTGKQLNIDTKGVLLHSGLGFACSRRSRETGVKFSTVPCEALKTELRRLNLAEEMRILYVAMTRAKENLIITCAHKNPEKYLASLAEGVREAIDTKGLIGVITGGLSAASAGITAAIFFGLIMGICCKSKEK